MPTIADMEANMRAAQDRLAQYSQTSPSSVRQEINAAWSPILDKAAGEVSKMKQEFLPRYFEGMMNTGYGMGTSEADLSPTQKLSQMGNMLGQFGGDLARGQSVVDYLGGSLKDQYAQALDALKWKTTLAQQEYDNWWQQYQFEKQLQDAAAARAAAGSGGGGWFPTPSKTDVYRTVNPNKDAGAVVTKLVKTVPQVVIPGLIKGVTNKINAANPLTQITKPFNQISSLINLVSGYKGK